MKGPDGFWRLTEVRHRSYSGVYVRTSGIGTTKDECLADWDAKFQRNRYKGSVRRKRRASKAVEFTMSDRMSAVFRQYIEAQGKRVEKGEIKQRSYNQYYAAIYPSTGVRAKEDAIKLDTELGAYSIAEIGRPSELASYIEDIAEIAPGMAVRHHTILTACFKSLTLQGLFDESPMRIVPRPDLNGGSQRALSADERKEFGKLLADKARAPRNHDYLLAFGLTLLGTGVRPSEALAFRWMDVPDLDSDEVGKATVHVCGTIVKLPGRKPYRQGERKAGDNYYLVLPTWLTEELRAWKRVCAPADDSALMFRLKGGPVDRDNAGYALQCIRAGSNLEWLTWGNLRDTVATEVRGRTGDHKRASAQLGHSEGSTMATRHYIDPQGYKREAVDNTEALDGLRPENDGNLTIPARFPNGLTL
ncbi:tyrosine-type recombinase/integrase [Nocardia otitidiscaviarum]|uniref:tyrosine-type recombinase/integrase n=1 Tax=Nocardia otitidiscaviarum TaxID=1823 RepID=UPI001893FD06|nr:hypothetical protein [Nocardia otitidiscaviarum]MBF6179894.1 hypothetical protein [Nocardia otitidiscaviarum]